VISKYFIFNTAKITMAIKISASLTKLSNFVGITEKYLKILLQNRKLSQEQLFSLYQSSEIELKND